MPVTKSGDQLQLGFRGFRENRLAFTTRVKDPHADPVGRILFMKEAKVILKINNNSMMDSLLINVNEGFDMFLNSIHVMNLQVQKGDPPQQPVCVLNIVLPDDIIPESSTAESTPQKYSHTNGNSFIFHVV